MTICFKPETLGRHLNGLRTDARESNDPMSTNGVTNSGDSGLRVRPPSRVVAGQQSVAAHFCKRRKWVGLHVRHQARRIKFACYAITAQCHNQVMQQRPKTAYHPHWVALSDCPQSIILHHSAENRRRIIKVANFDGKEYRPFATTLTAIAITKEAQQPRQTNALLAEAPEIRTSFRRAKQHTLPHNTGLQK